MTVQWQEPWGLGVRDWRKEKRKLWQKEMKQEDALRTLFFFNVLSSMSMRSSNDYPASQEI